MEADVSVCRVLKGLRHRGKDLKAERAPQPDRRRIGFDNRIELHRPVAVCACLVKDMPAQSPACALTAPGRMDNKAGIGNVCPRARVNGMRVRAPDDTSVIIYGDNGAPWQLPHPTGACARFGPRGIHVRVSPAFPTSFKIGQIAGQSSAFASRITMHASIAQPALI
jgi:hypothetical protein